MKIVVENTHTKTPQELLKLYETSLFGLETAQVSKRLKHYGKNSLKEDERPVFFLFSSINSKARSLLS
jgi:hypothetical protein